MGRAHSKTRADRGTYHRAFAGKLYRAPKGRRWTKPSVIVDTLEILAMKEGATGVAPLLAYARKVRDTLSGWKGKGFPKGNKGNVFLEYAWSQFTKHSRVLSEQDIITAHTAGKIDRWYNTLVSRPRTNTETIAKVATKANKRKLKRAEKKAKKRAEVTTADKWKAKGDEFRAKMAKGQEKRAEFARQYRAEQALIESLKAMLPK